MLCWCNGVGRRWKWLKPNESIIPLGGAGKFDACGVFGAKQDPLRTVVNDTLRLYYAGCNGTTRHQYQVTPVRHATSIKSQQYQVPTVYAYSW